MKRQIRNNVFETNSSSTHSICISKKPIIVDDINTNCVGFCHGEFGWEFNRYDSIDERASYLYQAICDVYYNDKDARNDAMNQIYDVLGQYGISCYFEPDKKDSWGYPEGYIDHGSETIDFVQAVLHNENRLLRFLFGDSFILTGNDNCYENEVPQYNVPESEYEIYYKGN